MPSSGRRPQTRTLVVLLVMVVCLCGLWMLNAMVQPSMLAGGAGKKGKSGGLKQFENLAGAYLFHNSQHQQGRVLVNDEVATQPADESGSSRSGGFVVVDSHATRRPVAENRRAAKISDGEMSHLNPRAAALLSDPNRMIDLFDSSVNKRCQEEHGGIHEKESKSNIAFLHSFRFIFKHYFDNLPWMLDEGGLIGSGRAGSMSNADDDFDFFCLLPGQHAPCSPHNFTCSERDYHNFIHKFLMVFWKEGDMCINKFHPDVNKFRSKRRLMYSFQLNRTSSLKNRGKRGDDPNCFLEGKPFAHMHLGILEEKTKGMTIQTNMWAFGTRHPMDSIPLDLILPVGRCRIGEYDAPCPRNVSGFLTVRNRGEYRGHHGGDGNCLLVRQKWGNARKQKAVEALKLLDKCGYNSMIDLLPRFLETGMQDC